MKDSRLEARQENFKKCKFNILARREQQNLTLRKNKLETFINEKRMKTQSFTKTKIGINPLLLQVEENLRNLKPIQLNDLSTLDYILQLLQTKDDSSKYAIYLLREFLSSEHKMESFNYLIGQGIIEFILYELQTTPDEILIFEMLWILINISYLSKYEENIKFTSPDFLQIYYKILNSQNNANIINTISLLTNVVCEHLDFAEILTNSEIIDLTYNLVDFHTEIETNHNLCLLRTMAHFYFQLVNKRTQYSTLIMNKIYKITKFFVNVCVLNDDSLVNTCIWGLMFISEIEDEEILNLFLNTNLLSIILALDLFEKEKDLLIPSIRIFGNLLSVDDNEKVDQILDSGVIQLLNRILMSEKNKSILKETIWVISNIAGGGYNHIKLIVESEVLGKLMNLSFDYDYLTKKEAIFTIMNICTANSSYNLCIELIKKGIFKFFIDVLESNSEFEVLEMILNSLEHILNTGSPLKKMYGDNPMSTKFEADGGVTCLEKLQTHHNKKIYERSQLIYDKYFSNEGINLKMVVDTKLIKQGGVMEHSDQFNNKNNFFNNSFLPLNNNKPGQVGKDNFSFFGGSNNQSSFQNNNIKNDKTNLSFHELFKKELPDNNFNPSFENTFSFVPRNNIY